MKNCTYCKYASLGKTAKGKLHPSGEGWCEYKFNIPARPQSMYWVGGKPNPCGGLINRRTDLKDHCAYFVRKEHV